MRLPAQSLSQSSRLTRSQRRRRAPVAADGAERAVSSCLTRSQRRRHPPMASITQRRSRLETKSIMHKPITLDPSSLSVEYLERLLEDYLRNPADTPAEWHGYLEEVLRETGSREGAVRLRPTFEPRSVFHPAGSAVAPVAAVAPAAVHRPAVADAEQALLAVRLEPLVRAYRLWGHLAAEIDPLGALRPGHPELEPAFHGFSDHDLARPLAAGANGAPGARTVGDLVDHLRRTYCRSIGVQFMHIDDGEVRQWLTDRMESTENRSSSTASSRSGSSTGSPTQ